jgi:DNA-binding transcriptional MerR regulator
MFKISEFSKLIRVSPRMLRHYEKCGLLNPAKIDTYSEYRLYTLRMVTLIVTFF